MSHESLEPSQAPPPDSEDTIQLLPTGVPEDETLVAEAERQAEGEHEHLDEAGIAMNGLQETIAMYKLRRVQTKLAKAETTTPREIAKRESRYAKIGRLGAANAGIAATYGEEIGGNIRVDPQTIPNRRARRAHSQHTRGITHHLSTLGSRDTEKEAYVRWLKKEKMALERKVGIVPEEDLDAITREAIQRPITRDNATINRLAKIEVTLSTHEVYEKLVREAAANEALDLTTPESTIKQLEASNPTLARFTLARLVRDGVIDRTGKVTMGPDKINEILTFSGQVQTPQEEAEQNAEAARREQWARGIFNTAEEWAKRDAEADTSQGSAHKKYADARARAWSEMSYMVDESDRKTLLGYFRKFLAETDTESAETVGGTPYTFRDLYETAEGILKLRLAEHPSLADNDKFFERTQVEVWLEVAKMLPEQEGRDLLSKFEQFRDEAAEHSAQKKSKPQTSKQPPARTAQKPSKRVPYGRANRRREPTDQEKNASSSLEALRNIIND